MIKTGILMQRWSTVLCKTFYLVSAICIQQSLGGACWKYIDDTTGLCKKLFRFNMTYDECCGLQGLGSISWSPHDDFNNIFYWNFLSKGAKMCQRCHKNCSSLVCDKGKVCRLVNGYPICVCKPKCDKALKQRGRLCGTDGRKYRNYCALLRHNCITEQQIYVEYFGKCRNSCKKVKCETGKHCLQDQNGVPHCITCQENCTNQLSKRQSYNMCGENGKTYRNTCELKADICKTGRTIPISHNGKCLANETCNTLACPLGTRCLRSATSGKPICKNCNFHCLQQFKVSICGTDNKTYDSYCDMVKSGCNSGRFVSTQRRGPCRRRNKRRHTLKAQTSGKNKFRKNKNTANKKAKERKHRHHKNKRRDQRRKQRNRRIHTKYHLAVPYEAKPSS